MKRNLKLKIIVKQENTYQKRLQKLEENIKHNQEEIHKLNKESTLFAIERVDRYFNDNLEELNDLIEIFSDTKDNDLKKYVSSLESLYKEVQNNYLNKKIEIMDEKMEFVNKSINESLEKLKEDTNNITGNILFSVIAIVLGVSLVNAMTGAITNMEPRYYFAYYITIGWLAVLVIGLAYLLLRSYDRKSKIILGVICLATLILGLALYFSFLY